jgi:hypothetical protein
MSLIKDFLKEKDEDYSKYIPEGYKISSDEKER